MPRIFDLMKEFVLRVTTDTTAWEIGTDSLGYLYVKYRCPHCRQDSLWNLAVSGNNNFVPDSKCCPKRVPYPIDVPKFAQHLKKKATLRMNGKVIFDESCMDGETVRYERSATRWT